MSGADLAYGATRYLVLTYNVPDYAIFGTIKHRTQYCAISGTDLQRMVLPHVRSPTSSTVNVNWLLPLAHPSYGSPPTYGCPVPVYRLSSTKDCVEY
eukprot:377831-Rhodomonas_salina.8